MLKGKKAIVTGGTSGIGKEIALNFAKNGASVVIFGTSEERAKATVELMEGEKVFPSQQFGFKIVDVSSYDLATKAVEEVVSYLEGIDILVNNAGITQDALLMKMDEEKWDRVIEVDLKSVFILSKAVIRPMMKQRYGSIINISSVIGLAGNPGQTNYAAAKAGMIGFTKSLAREVAGRNICVNCIAPGYVETPMTETLPESIKQALLEKIPMKRLGKSIEIANAALFLASDLSKYITGQTLTVDGGMVM
ncbi:MAG TPA: 3-oxoacyl-[acyl-carrier-protein] reductase [Chlamydiales bacterium]|nr:3-oxoacyl-[acyl-carrier-protein] reductase [Chlamydiales bacterium]